MSIYMQHEKKVGHLTMSYVNINCGIAYVQVEYLPVGGCCWAEKDRTKDKHKKN